MEGVLNEDRDLELDPLANGKPVELVPQPRSEMVELPLVRESAWNLVEFDIWVYPVSGTSLGLTYRGLTSWSNIL